MAEIETAQVLSTQISKKNMMLERQSVLIGLCLNIYFGSMTALVPGS